MFSTPATVAWTAEISPAGTPGFVGDSVLVYDGTDVLRLTSLDAATGVVRWSAEASTGDIHKSRALEPATATRDDGRAVVAYLQPAVLNTDINYYEHTLVVADVATGESLFTNVAWTTTVKPCALTKNICFTTFDPSSEATTMQTYDINTGAVAAYAAPVGGGAEIDDIGEGVYSYTAPDGVPRLGRYVDGATLWEKPAVDVIGEAVTTVQHARGSTVDDETNTMFLTVSRLDPAANRVTVGDMVTAAFDLTTGEPRWKSPSPMIRCTPLQILCSGDLAYDRESSAAPFTLNASNVTLARLDWTTGEQQWSTDLAEVTSLANSASESTLGGVANTLVFEQSDSYHLLHYEDGAVTDLSAEALVACSSPTVYFGTVSSNPSLEQQTFSGGARWQACSSEARPASEPSAFSAGAVLGATEQPDDFSSELTYVQTLKTISAFATPK